MLMHFNKKQSWEKNKTNFCCVVMNSEKILSKEEILYQIIGSGINISPKALESLKKAGIKSNDLEELLRKISFRQDFQSHITVNEIKQFLLKQEFHESLENSDMRTTKFHETTESEAEQIVKSHKPNKTINSQKAENANQKTEIITAEIFAEEIDDKVLATYEHLLSSRGGLALVPGKGSGCGLS